MNIQPDGAEDSEIVVVGESPSKDDAISGVPFSGSQGELLFDDILARAGIFRKEEDLKKTCETSGSSRSDIKM